MKRTSGGYPVSLLCLALVGCNDGAPAAEAVVDCLEEPSQRPPGVVLTPYAEQVDFDRPVLLVPHPVRPDVHYVAEQRGRVLRIDAAGNAGELIQLGQHRTLSPCGECGLLGMAFHPEFAFNGRIYLSYTEQREDGMYSVVAYFTSSDQGDSLEASAQGLSGTEILSLRQPFSNHNGGHIAFGPDGFLYVGLGDGGSANDPQDQAQNPDSLLGTLLRLTDEGRPAPGNPHIGRAPEIYAWGLRNPWRWSFDRATGDLWLADVGQNRFEEINRVVAGGNYGWRCYEGNQRSGNACRREGPFEAPVFVYDHSEGISVTGGYVYRGEKIPFLHGAYLFSDFGSGTLWSLRADNQGRYQRQTLLETGKNVASFAEDLDGELYVITFSGLFRIDPLPSPERPEACRLAVAE